MPLLKFKSVLPLASAAGNAAPALPPELPSAISRCWPIARLPLSGVAVQVPEVAAAYWTE